MNSKEKITITPENFLLELGEVEKSFDEILGGLEKITEKEFENIERFFDLLESENKKEAIKKEYLNLITSLSKFKKLTSDYLKEIKENYYPQIQKYNQNIKN